MPNDPHRQFWSDRATLAKALVKLLGEPYQFCWAAVPDLLRMGLVEEYGGSRDMVPVYRFEGPSTAIKEALGAKLVEEGEPWAVWETRMWLCAQELPRLHIKVPIVGRVP